MQDLLLVCALAFAGAVLLVFGVYLMVGAGPALCLAGAFLIVGAALLRTGMVVNG